MRCGALAAFLPRHATLHFQRGTAHHAPPPTSAHALLRQDGDIHGIKAYKQIIIIYGYDQKSISRNFKGKIVYLTVQHIIQNGLIIAYFI